MQIFNEWTQHGGTDPLREPNQLYRNLGNGTFADISIAAGRAFDISEVSRGAAVGDVDNDGDLDLLVTNNDGPTRLLINTTQVDGRWFGFDAVGKVSGRTMLGSLVSIAVPDTRQLIRRVATDGSYCSARDPRIVVDVDAVGEQPSVVITWPDGTSEAFRLNSPGTYSKLVQGEGSLVADDNESSRMETPAG